MAFAPKMCVDKHIVTFLEKNAFFIEIITVFGCGYAALGLFKLKHHNKLQNICRIAHVFINCVFYLFLRRMIRKLWSCTGFQNPPAFQPMRFK